MAIEPSFEELMTEAKPLGRIIHIINNKEVKVQGLEPMTKKEFMSWIARTRVAQAIRKAGGL